MGNWKTLSYSFAVRRLEQAGIPEEETRRVLDALAGAGFKVSTASMAAGWLDRGYTIHRRERLLAKKNRKIRTLHRLVRELTDSGRVEVVESGTNSGTDPEKASE